MAVYFRGEQRKFDANWERAKVITRLRDLLTVCFSESVSCSIPGHAVLQVSSGQIPPEPIGHHEARYTSQGITIAHLDVDGKELCSVRSFGAVACDGSYDLGVTSADINRSALTQQEAQTDAFFNRILERPVFHQGLSEFDMGNILARPTTYVAPEIAWYLLAPVLEAQFANQTVER